MLQNIDDPRYFYLLSQNYFFNKLTFFLNFPNNSIKDKTVDIIGKIIPFNEHVNLEVELEKMRNMPVHKKKMV